MSSSIDRIEKQILLRAPPARVWQALTDARQFGEWFKVKLESDFAVGKRVTGKMTYPGYEGWPFAATVESMEREALFSFRWSPGADPVDDPSAPTTLVEFRLRPTAEGTLLTVVESGFDRIPADKRAEVFRGNEEGWAIQTQNIKTYVEG
jgi:uncharacterized protein YndB with AHSA1/START domain